MKQREYTISTIFRKRLAKGDGRVPYLRMSGLWLEQFGFARGSRVLIAAEEGRIVLTIAPAKVSVPQPSRVRPRCEKRPTAHLAAGFMRARIAFTRAATARVRFRVG